MQDLVTKQDNWFQDETFSIWASYRAGRY